jgi:hypothetical protein
VTRDEIVAAVREKARVLYEGKRVAHRSCGIALAETFGRPSAAYQALRRGGITGDGPCGAILAGQLLLGELLGDPDPTGPTTPALKAAMERYKAEIARRMGVANPICDDLVRPFGEFTGAPRAAFCTDLAATVAEVVARIALDAGVELTPGAIPDR